MCLSTEDLQNIYKLDFTIPIDKPTILSDTVHINQFKPNQIFYWLNTYMFLPLQLNTYKIDIIISEW